MAKKPKGPHSLHWKKKADSQWSVAVRSRDMRCLVCGKAGLHHKGTGLYINGLDAHHLIGRTNLQFRYDLENGVSLCKYCHIFDPKHSPHYSLDSAAGFLDWLEDQEQWFFFNDNRHNRQCVKVNYQDEFERLKEINNK